MVASSHSAEQTHIQPDAGTTDGQDLPAKGASPKSVKKSFAFEAILVAFARVCTRMSTFLVNLMVARILGPEGRGLLAALQIPAMVVAQFAELGTRQAAAYYIGKKIFSPQRIAATMLGIMPFAATLSALGALAYYYLTGTSGDYWIGKIAAIAIIPGYIGTAYVTSILIGTGNMAGFSRANWIPAFIMLIIAAIALMVFKTGVAGVLFGLAAGQTIGFGIALYTVRQHLPSRLKIEWKILKSVQRLGSQYAFAMLIIVLNNKLMILLLMQMGTLREAGLYAQAAAIAELLWEVPQVVSALVFSRAVNAASADKMSVKILSLARLATVAAMGAALAVGLISPWLFPFLFGEEFAPSAHICMLMLPGVVAFVIFRILQQDVNSRGKAKISAIVMTPGLFLNLALGYFLIDAYGANGAAMASSATLIIVSISYIFVYSRLTGIPVRKILRYNREDIKLVINAIPKKLRRFI